MYVELLRLLVVVLVCIALMLSAVLPLAAFRKSAYAVLKRNFVGYFSNPTGYVFLCVFVLLTSLAAFWPHDFFASNVATLGQLNNLLPYIMLIYVPAITMSIWSEERREGTDELLLTIPAGDGDIVAGKYLAAASIFTTSLLFSLVCNFAVLNWLSLGAVDMGLFLTTYFGYWLMGLAMISIGMVASFLTSNLTVGFVLGALFNAPLAFAANADILTGPMANRFISQWSLSSQLADFGRGVISLSSIVYFGSIIAIGIYLSIVLIGRRHWWGGRDGHSLIFHYPIRAIALIAAAVFAVTFFTQHDLVRADLSSNKVSSLSDDTKELLDNLELDRTIYIEAYISETLPKSYVQTKLDMISLLNEIKARGGGKIQIAVHDDMKPFSEKAKQANERYDIRPVSVPSQERGTQTTQDIFLGAAFRCGLERVIVPFFGMGKSVEYELVRSLATVAAASTPPAKKDDKGKEEGKEKGGKKDDTATSSAKRFSKRQTLGVLSTDAMIMGTDPNDFAAMMRTGGARLPKQALIEELEKQYRVERVSPDKAIPEDKYEVLLVVQPSSLTSAQLANLMDAIRAGQPTAIFEDPNPVAYPPELLPGTDDPKMPPRSPMGRQMPPEPKCDIDELWEMLGVRLVRAKRGTVSAARFDEDKKELVPTKVRWQPFTAVVGQQYNPYPKIGGFDDQVVFANRNAATTDEKDVFNSEEAAVAGLHEVAFLTPGAIEEDERKSVRKAVGDKLEFTPLVRLAGGTSVLTYNRRQGPDRQEGFLKLVSYLPEEEKGGSKTGDRYDESPADGKADESDIDAELSPLYVSDGKSRVQEQFVIAARIHGKQGDKKDKDDSSDEDEKNPLENVNVTLVADADFMASFLLRFRDRALDIDFRFQNEVFVLNLLDALAGDSRFLEIRKRQLNHASLRLIEQQIHAAMEKSNTDAEAFKQSREKEERSFRAEAENRIKELEAELQDLAKEEQANLGKQAETASKLQNDLAILRRKSDERKEKLERDLEENQYRVQEELRTDRERVENRSKLLAVVIPPIPPLLIGFAVFVVRRVREREGMSKSRLR